MSTLRVDSRRRSGFTLIEVAIALALFVFGALAIVRIFPPALGVIRNNENRSTATQIGQTVLSRYSGKSSAPPEAVFDVDATSTQPSYWNDYPAAITGTATKNSSVPKGPTDTDYDNSALGHFRYIYGEPHYISAGQTILLNYPHDTSNATLGGIKFFADYVIDGVQINANGYLDFANAYFASNPANPFEGTGFTDPADPATIRPPNTYRTDVTYYVSYRVREVSGSACSGYGPIRGVVEEPMTIPLDTGGYSTSTDARVLPCVINSCNRVVPGGVQVRVRKNFTLSGSSSLGTDPKRQIVTIENTGTTGTTIHCSYWASDWRNLSYDSAPTPKAGAAGTSTVRLPINGLDNSTTVFGVLMRADQKTVPPLPDTISPSNVNYKKGEVEYPVAIDAPRIRTIYRTLDNWATQLSVAPRSYVPYIARPTTAGFPNSNFPREPWREYYWDGAGNLYFHASEAGKTVSLSCTTQTSPGVYQTLTGINLTIDDDLVDASSSGIPANFSTGKVAQAQITDLAGALLSPSSILSIQGLSISARTAWLNNDRYNQVLVPSYRALTN